MPDKSARWHAVEYSHDAESRYVETTTGRIIGSVDRGYSREWNAYFRLSGSPHTIGEYVSEGQAKAAVRQQYAAWLQKNKRRKLEELVLEDLVRCEARPSKKRNHAQ